MFKRWVIGITLALVVAAGWSSIASVIAQDADIPYYFIAIHNEPYHGNPEQAELLELGYDFLREMVARADAYNIKLTLMFSPQWADYIAADEARLAEVQAWEANGHEIAAHHHSIYHGIWDGYTNYAPAVVQEERAAHTERPEPYLGSLDDYVAALAQLSPNVQAGCVNDEEDKHVMPDTIIYDTCLGSANFGEPGTFVRDRDPEKGINEYISVGSYKGIARKWLAHTNLSELEIEQGAENIFLILDSSAVYGTVNHSNRGESEQFFAWLDFLYEQDPTGAYSRTVSGVIEEQLLPEVLLDIEFAPNYPCGDLVCDEREQANPDMCPMDCVGAGDTG